MVFFVTSLQEAGFFVFLFFLREGVFHWCSGLAPRNSEDLRCPRLGFSIQAPNEEAGGGGRAWAAASSLGLTLPPGPPEDQQLTCDSAGHTAPPGVWRGSF